jgi:hypothetical protein
MRKEISPIIIFLLTFIAYLFILLLKSYLILLCWNVVVPHIWKGLPELNFLQALALGVLVNALLAPLSVSSTRGKE